MRLSLIAAVAMLALAASSADARPPSGGPDTYGGSAWFNDYVGGVAVTGATLQECQERLAAAIAARSNWAVTKYSPCAKWPPSIRINAAEVDRSHAEVRELIKVENDLRRQFRIDDYERALEATFTPVNVCE